MTNRKVVCLAGGVGAARFMQGLVRVVSRDDITVVANTGDDIELHGLHISPDLDIIMYTLAGIVDETRGWGIRNDTFQCLTMLKRYGCDTWFNIGDQDFATHLFRTELLMHGSKLSEVTIELCQQLGLRETVLPMTDDRFETRIMTDKGDVHFQEYMVKHAVQDKVVGVEFEGAKTAKPCPEVLDAIREASGIIVCPSNPIVSIGTILAVEGVREALQEADAKVVAISPIIAGKAVKGPAEKLMRALGMDVSAFSVASIYKGFLDVFVLDMADKDLEGRVEALGIQAVLADTLMKTIDDKIRLAKIVISCLEG